MSLDFVLVRSHGQPRVLFDAAMHLVHCAVGFGLISGAALAAFIGQLVLAGMLAVLAGGMFLRFKRGRLRKGK